MKQYTRLYFDTKGNIRHLHTNTNPIHSNFEPVEDREAPYSSDVELDLDGTATELNLDNQGFVSAKTLRDNIQETDRTGLPTFTQEVEKNIISKKLTKSR